MLLCFLRVRWIPAFPLARSTKARWELMRERSSVGGSEKWPARVGRSGALGKGRGVAGWVGRAGRGGEGLQAIMRPGRNPSRISLITSRGGVMTACSRAGEKWQEVVRGASERWKEYNKDPTMTLTNPGLLGGL